MQKETIAAYRIDNANDLWEDLDLIGPGIRPAGAGGGQGRRESRQAVPA